MLPFKTAVLESPYDVEQRLADFGLNKGQLLSIRDAARAAADDASPLMPQNAAGTLAYIYGVEATRHEIIGGDWVIDRTFGVEAVINFALGYRICYQNVDVACDPVLKPSPLSAKGSATSRMCSHPLFDYYGLVLETDEERLPADQSRDPLEGEIVTYFVMVGEDGSIELSSPIIVNHRFSGFRERIFIDRPQRDWEANLDEVDEPIDDFEVVVDFRDAK